MLGKKNISGRGTGGRAEGGSGRGAGRGKDAHARPRPRCGSGPARPPGWGPPPFPTVSRPGGIYLTLASVLRARSPQPLGSRTPGSATPVDSPNEDEFGDEQPTRGHPQLHAARAVWHRGVHRRGGASAVRQKKSGPSRQPGMRVHPRECRSRSDHRGPCMGRVRHWRLGGGGWEGQALGRDCGRRRSRGRA